MVRGMWQRSPAQSKPVLGLLLAVVVASCGGATSQDDDTATTGGTTAGSGATGGTGASGSAGSGASSFGGAIGSGGTGAVSTGGVSSAGTGGAFTEEQLDDCVPGDDCIVVPYRHCCGATKRAINAAYQPLYEAHSEWQVFDDPSTCALIGICPDDSNVTEAWCRPDDVGYGTCELIYAQCPDIDCNLDCPFDLWRNSSGCRTCACAPPPLMLEPQGWSQIPEDVSLTSAIDSHVGAIDRTTFTVTWRYDVPELEDEEYTVTVQITLAHLSYPYFGAETTYTIPDQTGALEAASATWTLAGQPTVALSYLSGYLSVRLNGDTIEGGVYLVGAPAGGYPEKVTVGGAFREPNPWQ